jgi:hypothetical protein
MIVTPYDLSFKKEKEHEVLCTKELTKKEIEHFRKVCKITGMLAGCAWLLIRHTNILLGIQRTHFFSATHENS